MSAKDYCREGDGYECLTCFAFCASERSAQLHQEWHEENDLATPPTTEGDAA